MNIISIFTRVAPNCRHGSCVLAGSGHAYYPSTPYSVMGMGKQRAAGLYSRLQTLYEKVSVMGMGEKTRCWFVQPLANAL
jgi:hypothetical protein